MNRIAYSAIVALVFAATPIFAASSSAEEKAVWSLEDSYWRYVEANDLEHYRTLWHSDFLGWPSTSAEPANKDHITEWIAAHTSRGETLKSYDLERLAAQVSGEHVTVAYRVHANWVGKDGADSRSVTRIVHTWLHGAGDKWQIISGMGAAANAQGH